MNVSMATKLVSLGTALTVNQIRQSRLAMVDKVIVYYVYTKELDPRKSQNSNHSSEFEQTKVDACFYHYLKSTKKKSLEDKSVCRDHD